MQVGTNQVIVDRGNAESRRVYPHLELEVGEDVR
jgi:hypothetical protein